VFCVNIVVDKRWEVEVLTDPEINMPEVWQDRNHLILVPECSDQRNDGLAPCQVMQKFQLILYSCGRTSDVNLLDGYVFWRTNAISSWRRW